MIRFHRPVDAAGARIPPGAMVEVWFDDEPPIALTAVSFNNGELIGHPPAVRIAADRIAHVDVYLDGDEWRNRKDYQTMDLTNTAASYRVRLTERQVEWLDSFYPPAGYAVHDNGDATIDGDTARRIEHIAKERTADTWSSVMTARSVLRLIESEIS